jgi:hypothetical protein
MRTGFRAVFLAPSASFCPMQLVEQLDHCEGGGLALGDVEVDVSPFLGESFSVLVQGTPSASFSTLRVWPTQGTKNKVTLLYGAYPLL